MKSSRLRKAPWTIRLAVATSVVLLLKVNAAVVLGYVRYWPPDFTSDFLHRRESYFWHGYHFAFYAHLFAGPLSLVLGLLLMNGWLRERFLPLHRWLGRVQAMLVLTLLVPSGTVNQTKLREERAAWWPLCLSVYLSCEGIARFTEVARTERHYMQPVRL